MAGGIAGAILIGMSLAGCAAADNQGADDAAANTVTIVVHDSFPNDAFAAAASAATGYDVQVITAGDGGELTSQLVLTGAAPIADAFFGVDNIFASRLVDAGITDPHIPAQLPARAQAGLFDEQGSLVPVTLGATCINIDPAWFAEQGIAVPSSYEDLANETYRGLTVLLDPSTSTTGASFLVGTVAHFGANGFADYWSQLMANEVRIEQGWT
ncbi:MAG: thiamine ABC transporter substrate-binding protein, partial [Leucobacter sp.]|nr:thiamine ABC transporter substrate-binding protein [Leucobacter sp.]